MKRQERRPRFLSLVAGRRGRGRWRHSDRTVPRGLCIWSIRAVVLRGGLAEHGVEQRSSVAESVRVSGVASGGRWWEDVAGCG